MCGIAGIFYYNKAEQQNLRAEIAKMTACLTHRRPDDWGYYVEDHVVLKYRRFYMNDLKERTGNCEEFSLCGKQAENKQDNDVNEQGHCWNRQP
jgi:asparagine synthetase B (glutamine-hydrolysing)